MLDSNSALKINQGYGFKPGFDLENFLRIFNCSGPGAPMIMNFEAVGPPYSPRERANLASGPRGHKGPNGPMGPMEPMGPMGTHGDP